MFSSRLYPLFVRAVSFQTCAMTFEQLKIISGIRAFFSYVWKSFEVDIFCFIFWCILDISIHISELLKLRRKKRISSPSASGALLSSEMNGGEFQLLLHTKTHLRFLV
ncbi:hypothetical protein ABH14_07210 [Brevibacillus brevis]|nr:hypothetical protein [Brevibacillus brevis]